MRKPFAQFNVFWLSSKREEVALDGALGVFFIEEFLVRTLGICALMAQSGRDRRRLDHWWHFRDIGGWRWCLGSVRRSLEVLSALGIASAKALASRDCHFVSADVSLITKRTV